MSYKNKKKMALMSRRQALAACGIGAATPFLRNPMQILLRGLVDGLISNAEAATSVVPPRTLINYHVTDGPAPWYSYLPMSPYANGTPIRGIHVNTAFSGNSLLYKTKAVTVGNQTLYMPNLWASSIATPSGAAAMSDLVANMLIIRGIQGNSNDSHAMGRREMTRPVGTRPSLMGLVADASAAPVQSVLTNADSDGQNLAFKAERAGLTRVVNFGDPIKDILTPFDKSGDVLTSTFVTRRAAFDTLMQKALASLGTYAASNAPGSDSLFAMRNSAELFLKNGVATAIAAYPSALAKYKKLISDCASLKLVGITDAAVPLPAAGTRGILETSISGTNGTYATNSDLSTLITTTTYPHRMAENFAIAEVLVSQGLSQSICLASGFGGLYGVNYQNVLTLDTKVAADAGGWWNTDEHFGGSHTALIANSFMAQCLYSCIHELISVMKAKNTFSETVIFVTGDFGRRQSSDPGTNHASDACAMQVFSGAITTPVVIGNISQGVTTGDYGQNRPVTGIFGQNRPLNILDATSTIAGLARVTPPSDNNPSLVDSAGVPFIEKAKETA